MWISQIRLYTPSVALAPCSYPQNLKNDLENWTPVAAYTFHRHILPTLNFCTIFAFRVTSLTGQTAADAWMQWSMETCSRRAAWKGNYRVSVVSPEQQRCSSRSFLSGAILSVQTDECMATGELTRDIQCGAIKRPLPQTNIIIFGTVQHFCYKIFRACARHNLPLLLHIFLSHLSLFTS